MNTSPGVLPTGKKFDDARRPVPTPDQSCTTTTSGGSMRSPASRRLLASALAAGALITGALAAAPTAQASTGGYVALGDSYSSGVGSGSYISSSGSCERSTLAYPYLWQQAHAPSSFSFQACSGATTADVLSGQLSTLNSGTSEVSIT